MEKYAEYLKERENMNLIESPNGFATYAIQNQVFYLAEIYVRKHVRGSLEAYRLYKQCLQIARSNKCVVCIGSIDTTTNNWKLSVDFMKRLGFSESHTHENLTFFRKEII